MDVDGISNETDWNVANRTHKMYKSSIIKRIAKMQTFYTVYLINMYHISKSTFLAQMILNLISFNKNTCSNMSYITGEIEGNGNVDEMSSYSYLTFFNTII